ARQTAQIFALFTRQSLEKRVTYAVIKLLDQIGTLIRRHLGDQLGQCTGGQACSDIRLGGNRQIAEGVSTSLQIKRHQQGNIQSLLGERTNQVSNIGRIQFGNQALDRVL